MTERPVNVVRAYTLGERVVRPHNVFREGSRLMHGTVVGRVRSGGEMTYTVRWDHLGYDSRGYFWYGLDREATTPTTNSTSKEAGS